VEELGMVRGHYDWRLCMRMSNRTKAGRRADDFLSTGPSAEVDKLLEVMGKRD
jgi:hypothetical protein